ncbi:growth hormone receptor [Branchiostoma belcheri]|nr:growth hormone receptor [Branchiostoma belcheri]
MKAYGAAIDFDEARARLCPAHLLCVGSCDTGYATNEHGCLTCECNAPAPALHSLPHAISLKTGAHLQHIYGAAFQASFSHVLRNINAIPNVEEHRKEADNSETGRYTRSQKQQAQKEEKKSAVTDHVARNNCVIDWEGARVIDREDNRRIRWIKEAVWIRKSTPVMNRDEGGYKLSHVWDCILAAKAPPTLALNSGELQNSICSAMTCDLNCPGGLAKDAYGCELCQCALFDDGFCTHHDQHYKNGQKFLSDCEGEGGCCEMVCRCLDNHVTCETICPAVTATADCPTPVLVDIPEVCCQQYACNHDDTSDVRRELGLVQAMLTEGDCVSIDGTCDLHCLDGFAKNRLGCDICQCSTVDPGSCIHDGNVYRNGQSFVDPDNCDQRCVCKDGEISCELYCSIGDAPAEDCFKLELPGLCCTRWVCSEQEMYSTYDQFGIQVNRNADGSTLTVYVVRQNSHHLASAGEDETSCETARTTALNTNDTLTGGYVPNCSETGAFTPVQCHGNETSCETARTTALITNDTLTGGYVPTCTETGAYTPVQCHGSTGECWCADGQGQEVSGTRVGAGYQPDCSDYAVLSCPVLFCTITCQHGFAVGQDGCPTCDCKEEPGPLGHLFFTIDFPGLGYTSDMENTSSTAFMGTAQEIETNIKSDLPASSSCFGVSVTSLSGNAGSVGVVASGAITAEEDELTPAHTSLTMSSLTGHVGTLQMGSVDFPESSCCPSGFIHRDGSGRCYKFDVNNVFLSWEESRALCESAGAELLSIEDEDENAYIHHYVVQNILSADFSNETPTTITTWCSRWAQTAWKIQYYDDNLIPTSCFRMVVVDHPQYIHWTSGNDFQQQGHFVWATGGTVNYRRRPGDAVRDYAENTAKRCIAGGNIDAAASLDQTRCSFQLYYICEKKSACPARCTP